MVRLRDIYGVAQTVMDEDDGAEDGLVSVPVGGQPVYVEVLVLPGEDPGVFQVTPDSITVIRESSEQPVTTSVGVEISNAGWSDHTYETTVDLLGGNWPATTVDMQNGTGTLAVGETKQVTVHFSSESLPPGSYAATIHLEAPWGTVDRVHDVEVTIFVGDHQNFLPILHER